MISQEHIVTLDGRKMKMKNKPTGIEELDLTIRSYNALYRHGIKYIEDLLVTSEEELMRVRHLGDKSRREVLRKLDDWKLNNITEINETTPDYSFSFQIDKSEVTEIINNILVEKVIYDSFNYRFLMKDVVIDIVKENKEKIIQQAVELAAEKISKAALPKIIERMTK